MEALEAAIAAGAPCKQLAPLAAAALPGGKKGQSADAKPSGHAAAAAAALCKHALKALDSVLQQQQGPKSNDEGHWAAVAATHAVNALEACRACIKGSPDEPEAQRYSLLRRLVGLRRYDEAFAQGCRLLANLPDPQRAHSLAKTSGGEAKLRLSAPGKEESQRTVLMAVGCTLNIVLCAVELGGDSLASAVHLLEDIEPWARCADPRSGCSPHVLTMQRLLPRTDSRPSDPCGSNNSHNAFQNVPAEAHGIDTYCLSATHRLQDAASAAKTREQLLRVCRKVRFCEDEKRGHCADPAV